VIYDARRLDALVRYRAAARVRMWRNVTDWPDLRYWNDQPCPKHETVNDNPLCRQCGVILRRHQKVGALWLYMALRGFIADSVGTGKTAQVAALFALMKETGELPGDGRAAVICKPAAVGQWKAELRRMVPELRTIAANGTPRQRIDAYLSPWEVAILSAQTLAPAQGSQRSRNGDLQYLSQFNISTVVYDDVDAMRKRTNRGAVAVRDLAASATRVVGAHATPLQKRLKELYCMLEPVGSPVIFGTERQFTWRFVEQQQVFYQTHDRAGRQVIRHRMSQVGIKHDAELRELLAPVVLRRRPQDLDGDVSIPAIVTNEVWLDPTPQQAARYAELRNGVLRKLQASEEEITHPESVALWTHGRQICSGLATLDDGEDSSSKLDWFDDHITGDFEEDKVVLFVYFKPNVAAAARRLDEAGIGNVVLWGNESGRRQRDERLERFRDDPACRVLIGTTTIEQSLNLQVARHLVCVDWIPNPARMTQLAGRVRRTGSPFSAVYMHLLLLRGTQEEHVVDNLRIEQAGADLVWNEQGELFSGATPAQLLRMMVGRAA
jgi:SNF2 family DNA or RNA helicase